MLIAHLPRDSSVNRRLHGEAVEWGAAEHLLAAITDHLAAANWMTSVINGDPDEERPDYPEPVPRPGDAEDEDFPGPDQDQEREREHGDAAVPTRGPSPGELRLFFS
ncbi:hypothetical protein [Streptomyces albireticuli]|uniref:Uncharacterized protein n=1 Tax=Streptomyces albireticuli TaxID=1940 RepID=A0A2A2D269_9ACTN|nr:hypothetical protein [Streptomyces albireticuli]MCD9145174.1 hypothetical protein [Streptomyces albireticuli]MCD9164651.1 hypothetical protein [Streptomyces albireticuli]MCD9194916.1 hypothetical protein [Streptomyces albireticuli]PAU45412.1 hypothetical protein CK936_29490 [Streptomyces albireticuli]